MIQPRTLLSIQYLRGLAALAVVAHHTNWTHTDLGASGVDLFFVISGFIMVHVSGREPTPTSFLRARALRVVPLYWLVTLAVGALHQVKDPGHLALSLAFWPHMGPDGPGYPVVVQGWTLNYEAFFYVAFAVSLLLRPAWRLEALTVGLLALAATGAIMHPAATMPSTVASPLLLEFLAGAWLCRSWQRGWLLPGIPLLTVGIVALGMQATLLEPVTWRWLVWGLPAVLIVTGALSLESRLPRVPALLMLGNASYSIYLTHVLVLHAVGPLLRPLPAVLALPAAVVACIAVGWLTYRCVEQPVTRWLASRLAPRRAEAQHAAG